MYCTADKYDVPGLKTLALEKFKHDLEFSNSCSIMVPVTHELTKNDLPESDTMLRDLLVDAWLLGRNGLFGHLIAKQPNVFEELMTAAPWLSLAIHKRTLQKLRFVHVAKQAKCEKCKGEPFFTQEKDKHKSTATCRKCKCELPLTDFTVMRSEVLVKRDSV